MPVNRNALIRYKTIDKCLQNRYREWTLEDLIEACSEALYEYEGITKGISKRTIQLDIQLMRSDKLGYNAPIIVYDNKYYTYEEKGYSITNIPLTDKDLEKMSEAVEFMRQFKGFSHFRELDGMIQKLEDHVYSQKKKKKPVIDFEKNENLKGLEFLDVLYQSIIQQRSITLTYQSFKARQASSFHFHPYLLKEFRNRWFILGIKKRNEPIMNLALDRIMDIQPADISYIARDDFNAEEYFKDVIGVTIEENRKPEMIVLYVSHKHASYVITKPLHRTQKVIARDDYGVTIELLVQHNFELEKEILGLGEGIMVLAPERLKRQITKRLNEALDLYNSAINEKGLVTIKDKLENKGFAEVNCLFTKNSLNHLGYLMQHTEIYDEHKNEAIIIESHAIPKLTTLLVNRNVEAITKLISHDLSLKEIVYHQFIPADLLSWRQSEEEVDLRLVFFLVHPKISTFSVHVIPGTHMKKHNINDISVITGNTSGTEIILQPGGAVFLKPLIICRFPEQLKDKKIRFFELKFIRRGVQSKPHPLSPSPAGEGE